MSKRDRLWNGEKLTPLRSPCMRPTLCRYFRPWAAPRSYRRTSAKEVVGKVVLRTKSSLLVELFSMNSMMFPGDSHSDTIANCRFFMSS